MEQNMLLPQIKSTDDEDDCGGITKIGITNQIPEKLMTAAEAMHRLDGQQFIGTKIKPNKKVKMKNIKKIFENKLNMLNKFQEK